MNFLSSNQNFYISLAAMSKHGLLHRYLIVSPIFSTHTLTDIFQNAANKGNSPIHPKRSIRYQKSAGHLRVDQFRFL